MVLRFFYKKMFKFSVAFQRIAAVTHFSPILIKNPHRIIRTIGVWTQIRVLVNHRIHAQPNGEVGVVVPCRGLTCCCLRARHCIQLSVLEDLTIIKRPRWQHEPLYLSCSYTLPLSMPMFVKIITCLI